MYGTFLNQKMVCLMSSKWSHIHLEHNLHNFDLGFGLAKQALNCSYDMYDTSLNQKMVSYMATHARVHVRVQHLQTCEDIYT